MALSAVNCTKNLGSTLVLYHAQIKKYIFSNHHLVPLIKEIFQFFLLKNRTSVCFFPHLREGPSIAIVVRCNRSGGNFRTGNLCGLIIAEFLVN